jgi:SAM-dependent methyltransferase
VGVDLSLAAILEAEREHGGLAEFQQGDLRSLPFEDGTFDVVLSVFGATFAEGHVAVAGEIDRVLRPGGRLLMFNWCRRGIVGRLLELAAGLAPETPRESALLWGDEEHVRGVFAASAVDLSMEHEIVRHPLLRAATVAEPIEHHLSVLVATVAARRIAEREGRWPLLRTELAGLHAFEDERADGHYLVVLGRKRLPVDRPPDTAVRGQ